MSTPLSAASASSESQAWQELEDVFARLGQLARSTVAPQDFYRALLDETIRALSAIGGTVWLRTPAGPLRPIAQVAWPAGEFARDDSARHAHEALLNEIAAENRVVVFPPAAKDAAGDLANPTQFALLLAPVARHGDEPLSSSADRLDTSRDRRPRITLAIIEILAHPGASPNTQRGWEQFLSAICDLAADFHALDELHRLRQNEGYRNLLLGLSRDAHRNLNLDQAAYAVANEGRRIVGCDRMSVLMLRGRHGRLLAISGVSRPERRSGAARRLERLAELICRTNEPAFYFDGQCDALSPVAEAMELHAEESHARQIALIPLRTPANTSEDDTPEERRRARSASQPPRFVLAAEQFDANQADLSRERLAEVAQVCTTALYNALEYDRLPFVWLLRPIGAVKRQLTEHLPRTALLVAAVAAAIAALCLIPADFNIDATGTLQPTVRRDVFAPRSGLVDEVLVSHGAEVAAGQPLARLRDPSLELELKRVDGELATAQRQLDAVRATRTNRAIRDAEPVEAYRLSAEERELQQRLANLRLELELLNHERDELLVTSPIAGRVVTWDVANRLIARPVERGEVLVTIADLSADWQLELEVPDDRIGYVLAAQHELKPNLAVRFRLSSDDREQHRGHIAEVCQMVDAARDEAAGEPPTVLVKVALDDANLNDSAGKELRPGVSARAQIDCGRRPVGYVWLHDIWDTAIEWLRF